MPVYILPPGPGKCQVCAVDHQPHEPHNASSLYYQTWFKDKYGRAATWADAIEHCNEDIKKITRKTLEEHDSWTQPKYGPPINSIDKSEGEPMVKKLCIKPIVIKNNEPHYFVDNLEEAKEFFLNNSSGAILCKNGESEKVASSYPEAKIFYERE